jgi:hypothetical protein
MENEDETWDIDWDAVISKIEAEVRKYETPRVFHDEILKAPMRY